MSTRTKIPPSPPSPAAGQEEAIFRPFYQAEDHLKRRHGGLGLGLTIVRNTIEIHGGRVWAENLQPGPGSCFTVVLPLAARHPG